jgi:hypothetical protein
MKKEDRSHDYDAAFRLFEDLKGRGMLIRPGELSKGDRYRLEIDEKWRVVSEVIGPMAASQTVKIKLTDGRVVHLDETTTIQRRSRRPTTPGKVITHTSTRWPGHMKSPKKGQVHGEK